MSALEPVAQWQKLEVFPEIMGYNRNTCLTVTLVRFQAGSTKIFKGGYYEKIGKPILYSRRNNYLWLNSRSVLYGKCKRNTIPYTRFPGRNLYRTLFDCKIFIGRNNNHPRILTYPWVFW